MLIQLVMCKTEDSKYAEYNQVVVTLSCTSSGLKPKFEHIFVMEAHEVYADGILLIPKSLSFIISVIWSVPMSHTA